MIIVGPLVTRRKRNTHPEVSVKMKPNTGEKLSYLIYGLQKSELPAGEPAIMRGERISIIFFKSFRVTE